MNEPSEPSSRAAVRAGMRQRAEATSSDEGLDLFAFDNRKMSGDLAAGDEVLAVVGGVQFTTKGDAPTLGRRQRRDGECTAGQDRDVDRCTNLGDRELVAGERLDQRARELDRTWISGVGQRVERVRRSDAEAAGKRSRPASARGGDQQELQSSMNRKQAIAVFDRDEGIDGGAIEQRTPKHRASVIEGKAGGQHHGDAAAGADQGERAFKEQLVKVRVPVALPCIDTRFPRERRQRAGIIGPASFAAQHLPRRVPDDCVEPGLYRRSAGGVVKDLRKLERPVEEQLALGDRRCLFEKRRGYV